MRDTHVRTSRPSGRRKTLDVVPEAPTTQAQPTPVPARSVGLDPGIEVREEELETINAQCMYKLRCGCGRSWYELELKKFVQCPACRKVGLVLP